MSKHRVPQVTGLIPTPGPDKRESAGLKARGAAYRRGVFGGEIQEF